MLGFLNEGGFVCHVAPVQ